MSYTVDRTFTDDETFEWSLVLSSAGADPIDWEKYSAGYSLTRDGCVVALLTDEANRADADAGRCAADPACRVQDDGWRRDCGDVRAMAAGVVEPARHPRDD